MTSATYVIWKTWGGIVMNWQEFWQENHAMLSQMFKVGCHVLCVLASSTFIANERNASSAQPDACSRSEELH